MGSQQFIGILKEEYLQRQLHTNGVETVNQMYNPKGSLQNRLTLKPRTNSDMHCKQCGRNNHNTPDCIHLGKSKCSTCGKFGHTSDRCWNKGKNKRKKGEDKRNVNKKQKKNEINEGEEIEDKEEIITLNTEEILSLNGFFDPSEEGQYYNFNSDNFYSRDEINEPIIYYDWFSNSQLHM